MGYVLHILIALVSLALPELGLGLDADRAVFLPLLLPVPYLLALLSRRVLLAGRFRAGLLCERLLAASPPLLQLAAIALGWLPALERWTGIAIGLSGWPGLDLLAALLPFLVLEVAAVDAHARLLAAEGLEVAGVRSFQLRLFASALLPFALYLSLASLIGLSESLRIHIEEVSLYGAAFSSLLLLSFLFVLPALLRRAWLTAPLEPGPVRQALDELAVRAGFRCRELLVWKTSGQMANAAIVGFTPRSRIVLFTDALIAQLSPRELAAVFAHEIGHARGHHGLVFATFAFSALLGTDVLLTTLGVEDSTLVLGSFVVAVGLWYLAFGMLSRRFELVADLTSVELMGDAAPLILALERVTGAHAHRRSSWRHFSTADRIHFLARVMQDPGVGTRLRRRLRAWTAAALVAFAVVVALEVRQLAGVLDEDRAVAALRLGRYERAQALLPGERDPEDLLGRLVELGASLPAGERSPEELEARALALLTAGDLERAKLLLDLAVLRGRRDLAGVRDELEARLPGAEGGGTSTEEELPARWRDALDATRPPTR